MSCIERIVDQIARFYLVGSRADLCNTTICHRGSLCYDRMWIHKNLTRTPRRRLRGRTYDAAQTSDAYGYRARGHGERVRLVVTDANLEHFKGLPISFNSGGDNVVYSPESTSKSYGALREKFGTRSVVQGYGHLNPCMGKNAQWMYIRWRNMWSGAKSSKIRREWSVHMDEKGGTEGKE